ncbi:MAG: DUF4595 domain-containing protein [Muribaculaceae bacterium]|nr:DUF4595 domain-containing protein [Muribaculaceae bacterium]
MDKFLKMCAAVLYSTAMCVCFTSCSDDNDEPGGGNDAPGVVHPANVFTGKMPESVAGTTIHRNSEGLVTEMRTVDGTVITFDYVTASRAENADNTVVMTVDDDGDKTFYSMSIGHNGFVSKAYVKYKEAGQHEYEEGVWTLSYDNAGHLTKAHHDYVDEQGEQDYTVTIQWKDDNIIKTYKDNGWDSYTYQYTNSIYTKPLENKGAVFTFENIYPIEVYDFEWVYYAGLLGKGPKNLAISATEIYDDESYTTNFVWTLDANGYPTVFDVEDDDHPGISTVKFTWE